jgi:hypothetical protein
MLGRDLLTCARFRRYMFELEAKQQRIFGHRKDVIGAFDKHNHLIAGLFEEQVPLTLPAPASPLTVIIVIKGLQRPVHCNSGPQDGFGLQPTAMAMPFTHFRGGSTITGRCHPKGFIEDHLVQVRRASQICLVLDCGAKPSLLPVISCPKV